MAVLILALTLAWADNSQIEQGYYILRQAQNQKGFNYVTTRPPNSNGYVDKSTTLKKGWRYCYMTVAFVGEMRSYSNVSCAINRS
jgi:hypothetical protein